MRMEKLTQKAQSALVEAQHLAEQLNHATIEPEHLLLTLLRQESGVVPAVLGKLGVDPAALERSLEQALAALPRATGASVQVSMGRDTSAILREAESIAANMRACPCDWT